MGNGNIHVGDQTATRKRRLPVVQRLTTDDTGEFGDSADVPVSLQVVLEATKPKNCGAMAQQRCDSGRGYDSAPQEFVRLVGFSDPKAGVQPWVRPDNLAREIKR